MLAYTVVTFAYPTRFHRLGTLQVPSGKECNLMSARRHAFSACFPPGLSQYPKDLVLPSNTGVWYVRFAFMLVQIRMPQLCIDCFCCYITLCVRITLLAAWLRGIATWIYLLACLLACKNKWTENNFFYKSMGIEILNKGQIQDNFAFSQKQEPW